MDSDQKHKAKHEYSPEQRERRKELARLRYATNPKTKARYQEKARARIPVKCEYEKGRRRKEAVEEGRKFRSRLTDIDHANNAIMQEYQTQRVLLNRMDYTWRKHIIAMRHYGNITAQKQWRKHKHKPGYRQLKALRMRLWKFARGYRSASMRKLIGCSLDAFKKHVARQFTKGMSWENYGEWELDHIVPCTAFDLLKDKDQAQCFHYTNIQPLWKRDNIRKSNNINTIQPELLLHVA